MLPCSKADQSPLNLSLLPFNAPDDAHVSLPRSRFVLGSEADGSGGAFFLRYAQAVGGRV